MELANIIQQLRQIGLTNNEVKVYITCLQLGSSLASKIAEKSSIYRTVIYDILESLIEKGIISYFIKENRKYFHATSPDSLRKYLEEKERKIREQKESINSVIKQLKLIEQPKKEPYYIEVFSGKEGFKALLEDILKEGKDYKMIGYEALGTHLIEFYFAHWQKRRIKQKIKRRIIAKEKRKEEIERDKQLTEVRYLPNNYEIPTSTLIYGNKAILFLPLGDDFVAVRIESKKIVGSFNTYFELLWKIAKK
jgi:sugar-specific transcriptional regulator TrmB